MENKTDPKQGTVLLNKPEKKDENWIWRIILFLVIAGAIFLLLVSIQHKEAVFNKAGKVIHFRRDTGRYLVTLGSSLLMGGACLSLGALAGFLFGIPRIINSTSSQNPIKSSEGTVLHNDNLVQISDWLTKILVGVGLTQIYEIPVFLDKVGKFLAPCFNLVSTNAKQQNNEIGSAIAICVVLYFLILGFIACYLWTRFYFSRMLKNSLENENLTPDDGKKNLNLVSGNQNVTINEIENKGSIESY